MVVADTPFLNLYYYADAGIMQVSWKKKPTVTALQEAYWKVLAFGTDQKSVRLICTDLTESGSLDREQEAWLANVYYKKVYDAVQDDIFVAVVFSEEHFKAIVYNYQITPHDAAHDFIQLHYFTSLKQAFDWLTYIKKGQEVTLLQASS